MPITHVFLALSVVVIWGLNFIFVTLGLKTFPPLLLCALRFIFASLPLIFFVKIPKASFKMIAMYGLIMFGLQFSLLFIGMNIGVTPGMASLILQVQVFFSLFFAVLFLGEKPYSWQLIGALVSFSGIGLVAFHITGSTSFFGFLCLLGAAATWGVGNLITKKIQQQNMALIIWGSFIAAFPMMALSLWLEGPTQVINSLYHFTWIGVVAIGYIVIVSTWLGYGIWNWLLSRYPISLVVPFTLLIPVVGATGSILLLGESCEYWKIVSGLLVIAGVCINLLGARLLSKHAMNQVYD